MSILRNARSLQTEERFEEMLTECKGMKWDAVLFNETWREAAEEITKLIDGNTWFGSGGSIGKRGVGILLHKKWGLKGI